jgi:lipid II:glycine glycyltransferase (peptidoglycan interpeptide bridge formation enzyme)
MDEEKLWSGYKKRVRRDVRKAEKSGIYVDEIRSPSEIEEMFALYHQTMRRNLTYVTWTKKSFYSIYNHIVKSGQGKIFFAKKDGKMAAGVILLFSEDTAYYFFGASSEEYLHYCPNDLLVHRSICLAIQNGKRFFDLMTSKYDDVALMSFKEKWGAQKHPFYFYEKNLNVIRTWMWHRAWRLVNTPVGSRMVSWWRGR